MLAITTASIPFVLLSLGLLACIVATMLIYGDLLLRVAIMVAGLASLPWSVGMCLALSTSDAAQAEMLIRFSQGSLALVGPALLFLWVVFEGMLERYRFLVIGAGVIGVASCIVAWSTDLVVAGVWMGSLELWHPKAGPLSELHLANLVIGAGLGVYLATHELHPKRPPVCSKQVVLAWLLIAVAAADGVLLNHGIGVYPLSVVSAIVAMLVVLHAIVRNDLLHSRGFDWGSAYELFLLLVLAGLVLGATEALFASSARGRSVVLALIIFVPLFGGTQALVLLIRDYIVGERRRVSSEADQALEELADSSLDFRSNAELAEALVPLIENITRLTEVRLLICGIEGKARPIDASPSDYVLVDRDLYDWLVENQAPLVSGELPGRRLGRLRKRAETLISALGADLLMPLVDREVLVGLIAAANSHDNYSLGEAELQLVQEAGRTAAKTLTYIGLFREAENRIGLAKELEVAAAVQHARTPGEERRRYGICEVIAHYYPAARFGGDWWMSHELPDGRVAVVIGDVTGRGVPAALVSSSVASACQTVHAMLGDRFTVLTLLDLLGDAVEAVGGEHYAMSCFAAVFDLERGEVSFANAGHPFPYRCRAVAGAGARTAELSALISRGTRLGTHERVLKHAKLDIRGGDVVVFYSDAVVEATNAEGRRYSERRLQRVLERYLLGACERACEIIVEDVMTYCGNRQPSDDITLVVVRLGRDAPA